MPVPELTVGKTMSARDMLQAGRRPASSPTQRPDAVISARGFMNGRHVHICALELNFIGGSMGVVVGEKITRAIEAAVHRVDPNVALADATRSAARPPSRTPPSQRIR